MIVMKFGGTSVGDRDRMARVAELINAESGPVLVVVSAMGKTTDHLLEAAKLAERGKWIEAREQIEAIKVLNLGSTDDPAAQRDILALIEELSSVLQGIFLLREQTSRSRALVASFGERLSVHVLAAHLRALGRSAQAVDARNFVVTDETWEEARVDLDLTFRQAVSALEPMLTQGRVPVVTGFIGRTEDGITTTLGRGGSDYSAALIGSLLGADEIWIWTDVDGILTADPRLVREARTLEAVSYREAAEMAWFGAKVLHPKTMLPAMTQGIPIRIRSTFAPHSKGTLIAETAPALPQGVKTVTSIRDMALVTVDGRGMAGVPGVARRIFRVCEDTGVSVVMISQASSEQTVSFVVPVDQAGRLAAALRDAFSLEISAGVVDGIDVRTGVAVLSIIGQGMAGTPGVSGKLFTALGKVGVNVLAIAQGASELSISVAVEDRHVAKAVRAAHTRFGLTRVAYVVLVGRGRVGRELLRMLGETKDQLANELGLELRLVALATSSKWAFDEHGLTPDVELDEDRPDDLVGAIADHRFTDVILVDVSAAKLGELHRSALAAGMSVVTANKVPLSEDYASYRGLIDARRTGGGEYGYETTFGAGLPVLHTLKELLHTGDSLRSVSGCFSGTLGFLCTRLQDGAPLADAVAEAEAKGFTEPDPREDLSGRDVARKALIIARAMGRHLEPEDIELEALVADLEHGLAPAMEKNGPALAARIATAAEAGNVLRYVAEIDDHGARVGLREVPADSPIGSLRGPDNILVFRTSRYDANPLVIRGPGAGAEVTAAGVLGDMIKVAQRSV